MHTHSLPFRRSLPTLFANYRDCERATTAIEFAFVAPMIVAIMLAAFQVAIIFTAQSYLETIAEFGERYTLTNAGYTSGQAAPTLANFQAAFKTALCQNVNALFTCNNLIVQLQPVPTCSPPNTTAQCMANLMPQFDASGNLKNPVAFNAGSPETKMILTVMYQWPVVSGPLGLSFSNLGNGAFLLASTQVFQIELCTNSSNGCVPNG